MRRKGHGQKDRHRWATRAPLPFQTVIDGSGYHRASEMHTPGAHSLSQPLWLSASPGESSSTCRHSSGISGEDGEGAIATRSASLTRTPCLGKGIQAAEPRPLPQRAPGPLL